MMRMTMTKRLLQRRQQPNNVMLSGVLSMMLLLLLLLMMMMIVGTTTVQAAQLLSSNRAAVAVAAAVDFDFDVDSSLQHYHRDLQQDVTNTTADNTSNTDDAEPTTNNDNRGKELTASILSNVFLFFLIFGLSATVEMRDFKQRLSNHFAIGCGVSMQYGIMPVLGFVAVKTLQNAGTTGLTQAAGLSLLVVTSSPGGSYSNWWCSTFNADLALSVAMTTVSSIMSVFMLPLNLFFYTWLAYGGELQDTAGEQESVVKSIDFKALFYSLAIVMAAISSGLYCGYKWDNATFHTWANRGGSVSGILLILFGLFLSTGDSSGTDESSSRLWNQGWPFYVAVAFPCLLGMLLANIIARSLARLSHPETVAIAIECCYQNTGIATSVAITMFDNPQDRAQAIAVPIFYGIVEAVAICIYCLVAWKMGWTKAPPQENFCIVVTKSYEVVGHHGNEEAEEDLCDEIVVAQGGADQDVSLISSASTRFSNEQLQVSEEGIPVAPNSSTATNTTTLTTGSMETSASEHDKNKGKIFDATDEDAGSSNKPFWWSRIVPAFFLRPRAHSSSTASESMAGSDFGYKTSSSMDQQTTLRNMQSEHEELTPHQRRGAELTCLRNRLVSDYSAETVASSSNNNNNINSPLPAQSPSISQEVAVPSSEEAVCSTATPDVTTSTTAAHDLTIPQLRPSAATAAATAAAPTTVATAADDVSSLQQQQDDDDDDEPSSLAPKEDPAAAGQSSKSTTTIPRAEKAAPMDRQLSSGAWFL